MQTKGGSAQGNLVQGLQKTRHPKNVAACISLRCYCSDQTAVHPLPWGWDRLITWRVRVYFKNSPGMSDLLRSSAAESSIGGGAVQFPSAPLLGTTTLNVSVELVLSI